MYKTRTCTRQQLIDAIENGILAAGEEMPTAERTLLRHVAATETRFLVGVFYCTAHKCGCPLTSAGLYVAGVTVLAEYQRRFYIGFDRSFGDGIYFEVAG